MPQIRENPIVRSCALFLFCFFASTASAQNRPPKVPPEKYWSDAQVIALIEAVDRDDAAAIDKVVEQGVDVNEPHVGENGRVDMTPLAWALLRGKKLAYERLLTHGADPNRDFRHYGSLLFAAALLPDSFWLKAALEHGGDPNLDRRNAGQTPIFAAVGSGGKENVELLLKAGAEVDHHDAAGETPLLRAAGLFNSFGIVHYLLEEGANYRLRDIYGRDLAHVVVEEVRVRPDQELGRWREKVIHWLTDHGVRFVEVENKLRHRRSAAEALERWRVEQEERWKRWAAIDAKDARDFRLRGSARLALENVDGAVGDFTRAVELEPHNAASYKLRGDAWYLKGLFADKRADEYEKAIADCTEALRLDPKWADPHAARAQIYFLEGDYRMAVSEYSDAIRLDPNNAVLYWRKADAGRWFGYWSGTQAAASDAYAQAIADCDKSISIDKFDPRAYHARALAWMRLAEYDKAIADDSQAIKLDAAYTEAYADRGDAYYLKSLTAGGWKGLEPRERAVLQEKALQDLSEALRLDPKNAQAQSRRAKVRVAMRDYDRALADFDEAIQLDPNTWDYLGRGDVWKAKGNLDRAIADFTEGIRIRENGVIGDISVEQAYARRGDCWLAKKDYEKAIADFTAAGADSKRRDVWSSLGQYEKVIDDLAASIAQDPKNVWNYQALSLVLVGCPNTKLRDHKRAIENAEKACEVTDWRNSAFLDNLAKVNAATENFEDAVKWECKAIEFAEYDFLKERYRKVLAFYEQGKVYEPEAQEK